MACATCRGLALLNNIGVVSASHDQTLRVWTFEGECIAELVGHTALVYSAAGSDDGSLIASASEDNTVRTWRPDGQCLQTLEHPGIPNLLDIFDADHNLAIADMTTTFPHPTPLWCIWLHSMCEHAVAYPAMQLLSSRDATDG